MSYDPNLPPEDPAGVPPPLEAPLSPDGVTEGTGLPRNIAAALSCIFPLVGGIVFYMLDRRDRFVRFYALQSIVLGVVSSLLSLALRTSSAFFSLIPFLGRLFVGLVVLLQAVLGILFLILWILLIWNAYSGRMYEMPVLWRFAKRHIPQTLQ